MPLKLVIHPKQYKSVGNNATDYESHFDRSANVSLLKIGNRGAGLLFPARSQIIYNLPIDNRRGWW